MRKNVTIVRSRHNASIYVGCKPHYYSNGNSTTTYAFGGLFSRKHMPSIKSNLKDSLKYQELLRATVTSAEDTAKVLGDGCDGQRISLEEGTRASCRQHRRQFIALTRWSIKTSCVSFFRWIKQIINNCLQVLRALSDIFIAIIIAGTGRLGLNAQRLSTSKWL